MPLLPDSLRQQLAPAIKYHFWILAVLMPLLLVPALLIAAGQLRATIDREKATIDSHVSALNAVRAEPDHPNDAWVETFDGRTAAVRKELLQEWQRLWDGQASLRTWPLASGLICSSATCSGIRTPCPTSCGNFPNGWAAPR